VTTRNLLLGSLAIVVAACGAGPEGHDSTTLARSQQAVLSVPGLVPTPCALLGDDTSPQLVWDGSQSDLMAADAFAECGLTVKLDDPTYYSYDDYLDGLLRKMKTVTDMAANPDVRQLILSGWIFVRSNVTSAIGTTAAGQSAGAACRRQERGG